MKITYIHHSSFLIEQDHCYLLFDYFEGAIPSLDRQKPLFVFSSHRHGDHFASAIFGLEQNHPQRFFLLSDDIPRQQIPDSLKKSVYLMGPYQQQMIHPLFIKTYRSNDEGVAFLIKSEGKTIFHSGDLNRWYWSSEPELWNRMVAEQYHHELSLLKKESPDIAFLPLDPRLEDYFHLGIHEFMSKVDAKLVFPMHFWEDYDAIKRFKQLPCTAGYRDRILEIHHKGECYDID